MEEQKTIYNVFDEVAEVVRRRQAGQRFGYLTSFSDLNEMAGGEISFGTNLVIGARTGVGKSTFSNILMMDMLELNKKIPTLVLYWNFEMTNIAQVMRVITHKTGIPIREIKAGNINLETIKKVKEEFKAKHIWMMDYSVSAKVINDYNNNLKEENPTYTIINIIDHTRLICKENESQEEQKLFNLMFHLNEIKKRDYAINIIVSQMNREIEKATRSSKDVVIPMDSDLFGGDSVAQFADIICLLFRPEKYGIMNMRLNLNGIDTDISTENRIFNKISKNRDGDEGLLIFDHCLVKQQITQSNLS